ncbi:MAG: DUF502 domain-containing protein [Lysobacterales bacterium]|nr:MAG: DUF502 domain-containing protein [Xanthomonadales bacterium]
MQEYLLRIWRSGVVGTFLTGLFFILPVVLTIAIVGWIIGKLQAALGPGTWLGDVLSFGGSAIAGPRDSALAFWLGVLLAVGGIWLLGFVVRTRARSLLERTLNGLLDRLPIVRAIYGPISQVVSLLRGGGNKDIEGMSVVLCRFGRDTGASMLGLLTSPTIYTLNDAPCHLVYLPGSPLPMSGALTFVPTGAVLPVPDLDVDGLMRIYFSLGALTRKVIPARFVAPSAAGSTS